MDHVHRNAVPFAATRCRSLIHPAFHELSLEGHPMKRFVAIAVLAVLFASCGASVDPALQSKIGTYFGKTASRSYSGSAFHVPMPLSVGQYVVYGVSKGDTR